MLVLTRRMGEELTIGDDIKLVVLAIHGNQVKIGIAAPKDINILRCELADRNGAEAIANHRELVRKPRFLRRSA